VALVIVVAGAGVAGVVASVVLAGLGPLADALADRSPVRWPPPRQMLRSVVRPPQALLASTVAGVVVVAVVVRWHRAPAGLALVLAVLVVATLAALVDRRCHRLPDVLVLPLAGASAFVATAWSVVTGEWWRLASLVVGAVVAGGVLGVAWTVGMGLGDVKFGAALAGVAAWPAPSIVEAVSAALGLVALAAILATGWWLSVAARRRPAPRWFPFGPFLATSMVAVVLWVGAPASGVGGTGSPCGTGPPVDSWVCSVS